MRHPGQIAVVRFPQSDLEGGKLRPVLLVAKVPGGFDDWLVCMISSQLRHEVKGFDEIVCEGATDFGASGLKARSLIRVGRLAVVDGGMLVGAVGEVSPERLLRIKSNLAAWLTG
jgi:mRNA interferase MazF